MVIVQHLPQGFTSALAKRLNTLCAVVVAEAPNRDRLLLGRALIEPGHRHTMGVRSGHQYAVTVKKGPPASRRFPSVDVLSRSVARIAGTNAVGAIMTGTGDDGAAGLKEMFDAGASTFGQD